MRGTFSGNESKITFYDIQANRFHWKLEIKTDTDWKEVYRIIASRQM
ncbi:hypothetical protein [Planctobacterium marinum]|uniref:Uncharacterized protein n=1 Tax=Planctobacterium marinum TaxID=1631968 RepID=A0AA48KRB5_9ALTE|nr:hypothetical protein MACH26_42070 [Planctobacterium marinum]